MEELSCSDKSFSELNSSSSFNTHLVSTKSISTNDPSSKTKIFEVIHKKIMICKPSKNKNGSERVEYQCIYCDNKYPTLHRIKSHLKFHVSSRIYIIII